MSHALSPVTKKDAAAIVEAEPFKLPATGRIFLYALVLLGVGAFVWGVTCSDAAVVRNTWSTFQVNFLYWFMVAAASTGFAAVFHICNAEWARPIKRLFESSNTFFFYMTIPLIVLYLFGSGHLFVWTHEHIPGKGPWLTTNFVYIRDILGVLLLAFVSRKVVYYSLRRDIGAIRSGLTGASQDAVARWSDKAYDKYVVGWGNDADAEIKAATGLMGRFSPAVVIIYALVMTFIAFDQLMSVDPHWYSTLYGALYFMAAVYVGIAWVCVGIYFARNLHPLFRAKVQRRTLHDIGKLLFGFGIFWAYMFWSHYLPIWYGNIPEETGFIILRLREEPWHTLAWCVLGMCFIVPFLLGLSRDVKQVPFLLMLTALLPIGGVWLQQYLLFVPSLSPDVIPLNYMDIIITLGFAGAFLLSSAKYLSQVPLMPFGDLLTKD